MIRIKNNNVLPVEKNEFNVYRKVSSTNDDDTEKKKKQTNDIPLSSNIKKKGKRRSIKKDQDNDEAVPSKKLKSGDLLKPLTVEEITQLNETESLFHSNFFRLQLNELLNEVKIREKYINFVHKWLIKFNDFLKALESLPEGENLTDISWLRKSGVAIPLNITEEQKKAFCFKFLKPTEDAFIVGSYQTGSLVGANLIIDFCVVMPSKCFLKEDYLNLMYDTKRALYLSYIASKIDDAEGLNVINPKFNYYRNNLHKPVLELSPKGKEGEKFSFRIFVCPEKKTFKLSRFVPWNNNIRSKIFDKSDDGLLYATPHYNANVLFDLTMKSNQEYIENLLRSHKNIKKGLILLKIWLKQRNFDSGYSGFGSFVMAMWIAYLFKTKKIHVSMSIYQIVRTVWNHLVISEWDKSDKGVTLCDVLQPGQPTLEQFHVYYEIVFIDTTGYLNLCANLSPDLYSRVKLEAQYAIDLLNKKNINSFKLLFMEKVPVYANFDHILKICDYKTIDSVIENHCEISEKVNFAAAWYPIFLRKIISIIRAGLSDRVISIVPIETPSFPWSIKERPIRMKKCLCLGFILNHDEALRILDKGPQANEEIETQKFREFWGEKSKLRQFKDGSIVEACVWASAGDILSQKRNIVQNIIYHLLNHHFAINRYLQYFSNQLDLVYAINKIGYRFKKDVIMDAESTALNVIRSFDELGNNLRELNDLKLDVHSIQGISPVFRYCDPEPILNNGKTCIRQDKLIFNAYKVIEGVIQLGASGKWPTDISAFKRIKTAFHIHIARELKRKYKYKTRGSIEGIYVLKDGFVFRLEIAHQREIILTRQQTMNNEDEEHSDPKFSLELEKRFNIMPVITSILHSLYQQYTCFGPAVMIAKRWLYSQLIDPYLWPDECTELLTASLFLNASVYQSAFQPQTVFLRFLKLLATYDWENEMIFLNFNNEISQEEIFDMEHRFNKDRSSFPPLTIITSCDIKQIGIWTNKAPSVHILARVTVLARHALNIIETKYMQNDRINNVEMKDLFAPNLDGYDVLINLRPNHVIRSLASNIEILKRKTKRKKVNENIPAIGLNFAEIGLKELREGYSDFAVFFYNPCGGLQIGVIWKPDIFTEKDFKVASVNGCSVTKDGKLKCNPKLLIRDFKIVLKDLYLSVEDKSKKNK